MIVTHYYKKVKMKTVLVFQGFKGC